jgi:Skp family chaperone for outer membrane proteins
MKAAALLLLALFWQAALVPAAAAQQLGVVQSPILTIESERLFTESAFGQRIAQEIEEEGAALAAENRRIEGELTAEEKDLTERRATMEPEAFRELADAFDQKVQQIRRTQDAKARALTQRRDAGRVAFLQAAVPVLEELMQEAGAAVVLERGSVFLSANASDITDAAISRMDASIGDGQELDPAVQP